MKRHVAYLMALTMVVLLLASPLATSAIALEATTTKPYTTTTTTWVYDCISTTPPTTTTTEMYDCISTTPPMTTTTSTTLDQTPDCNTTYPTTTTSTTLNLTGPEGINPDYNTTFPTTTTSTTAPEEEWPQTTHPVTLDLLSTAYFYEHGNISLLANPNYGGEWMSADCYTYDGASISILPQNGGPWDIKVLRYLHVTVTANVPFALQLVDMAVDTEEPSFAWFADAFGVELVDGFLPKGKYVGVIDLYDVYSALLGEEADIVDLAGVEVLMSKPGSITVGHIALSPDDVCTKTAPEIQTTTRPSFPTTGTTNTTVFTTGTDIETTTTTETTTSATAGDTTFPPTTTTTLPAPTGGTSRPTTTAPSGGITTTAAPAPLRGDVNDDGTRNMFDALNLYAAVAGDNNGLDVSLHDLNEDGSVNMLDCLILYNFILGLGAL